MITKNINGQNLSQAFINAITDSTTPYLSRLVYNNSVVQCDIKSMTVTKGTVGSMEGFNIGAVVSSELSVEAMNLSDDLKGKIVEAQIGLITDESLGTVEYIRMGRFIISTAEKTAYVTKLVGYGYTVGKTGGGFISPQDLLPPQTLSLANIASQIENGAGVNIIWDSGIDTTAVLDLPMSGITNYQALQILASVVGGYAVDTNDGDIYIGLFDDTVTHSVSAGLMRNLPKCEEQDFEITGVYVNTSAGAMGSQTPINLVTDSQWLTLNMFTDYETNIVGYTYRPADCGLTIGDPRIEGTDVLEVVNIDGSTFVMPCHKVVHKCTGGLSSSIQSAVATQLENAIATPPPLSEQVTEAMSKANEALEAIQDIGDTAEYFWHTTTDTGAGAGAHITQIPQQQFLPDPENGGGNSLITSEGFIVRDGLTELMTFRKEELLMSLEGMPIFAVRATDMRETQKVVGSGAERIWEAIRQEVLSGAISLADNIDFTAGDFEIKLTLDSIDYVYTFSAYGTQEDANFTLTLSQGRLVYSSISALSTGWHNFKRKYSYYTSSRAPIMGFGAESEASAPHAIALGKSAKATKSNSVAFQSGEASAGSSVAFQKGVASGGSSVAFSGESSGSWARALAYLSLSSGDGSIGLNTGGIASGSYAVCLGYGSIIISTDGNRPAGYSEASGDYSLTANCGTKAGYDYQTAIGKYNDNQSDTAFEIGNGTANARRSNAFEIDWSGNVRLALDTTAVSGDDYNIYTALTRLGWTDVIV